MVIFLFNKQVNLHFIFIFMKKKIYFTIKFILQSPKPSPKIVKFIRKMKIDFKLIEFQSTID